MILLLLLLALYTSSLDVLALKCDFLTCPAVDHVSHYGCQTYGEVYTNFGTGLDTSFDPIDVGISDSFNISSATVGQALNNTAFIELHTLYFEYWLQIGTPISFTTVAIGDKAFDDSIYEQYVTLSDAILLREVNNTYSVYGVHVGLVGVDIDYDTQYWLTLFNSSGGLGISNGASLSYIDYNVNQTVPSHAFAFDTSNLTVFDSSVRVAIQRL